MRKPIILVVDDEPLNLKLVAECLNADYHLRFARNGYEALAVLEKISVDLMLLDIVMPDMNGFSLAETLTRHLPHITAPIVYLTGDNSEETISRAFDLGAADYIIKPFRKKELIARVKNRIETEALKQEQALLLAQNQHQLAIIDRYVAYIKTDTQGIISEVSKRILALFSCQASDLLGKNINILKSGNTDARYYSQLWLTIEDGDSFTYEVEDINFQGGTNWYEVTVTPDLDLQQNIIGYVAFYVNIDARISYAHEATTDHLTGLHNRASLDKRLAEEIARQDHYGESLSVIITDIDYFKRVNDEYGHDVGDTVLKEFAHLLTSHVRESDFVARFGGEEFMILCPNTSAEQASILAEKLRNNIANFPFERVGHKTASFGVAEYQQDLSAKQLFVLADQALYQAKKGGRNQVKIATNTEVALVE